MLVIHTGNVSVVSKREDNDFLFDSDRRFCSFFRRWLAIPLDDNLFFFFRNMHLRSDNIYNNNNVDS